ncbi:MAG: tRNA uridine-5-carboxymethylaminomethyl(34) synthesis GTPase MnmE [Lentisphaeria bacterium]|nr:tRNA uridine-5-carboxymethylaminomethyl(34) synthesis GTPase MnmE [Lentisphaeria bacterium]
MNTIDNICALATGTTGAISIIRLSGENVLEIGNKMWQGKELLSFQNRRKMLLGNLNGDQVLAVYFANPHSYTGEDVVEFHCHGGLRAAKSALESALANGCRMAEPGEFTFRAFVNGKLDLVQAEAVCDLIESSNDLSMKIAEKQLAGALSQRFSKLRQDLTFILSECESRLDFSEENLDWDETLAEKVEDIVMEIEKLCESFNTGSILRNGIKAVIAGKPNAGKSSLLNLLLGYERAIVTDIAGTTRDTLEESVSLRNIPTRLVDTAGLRDSTDKIEAMGIDRSRQSIKEAEIIFWLLDSSSENLQSEIAELLENKTKYHKIIVVWNKIDLLDNPDHIQEIEGLINVRISAEKNWNIEKLLDAYENMVWDNGEHEEPEIAINSRHLELLQDTLSGLPEAIYLFRENSYELAAVQIQAAIKNLGLITGETADVDVLGEIFGRFCIGK